MDSYKLLLCVLLSCVASNYSTSSGGPGVAPQTCGTDRFYCRYSAQQCLPRTQRCIESNVCNNPNTGAEELCNEVPRNPGHYFVELAHANLGLSGSRKRSSGLNLRPEHQFITYRGFTYEFGSSYGVQVLDIADPIYKYAGGRDVKSTEIVGSSSCTMEDANMFVEFWRNDEEYNLITNNCQDFACALQDVLLYGPCTQSRNRRQVDNNDLRQYIDRQLRNCSLVCCEERSHSSKLTTDGFTTISIITTLLIVSQ